MLFKGVHTCYRNGGKRGEEGVRWIFDGVCHRELQDGMFLRAHSLSTAPIYLTWKEVVFLIVALDTKAVRVALEADATLVMGATRAEAVEKATVEAIL